jgi:hypothetical protein
MLRHLILIATPLLFGVAASSCTGNTWSPPTVGDDDDGLGPSLVGIGVTPHDPKVTLGEDIQFVATGYYDDQSTLDITATVDWYSTEASVMAVEGGLDLEGVGETAGAGFARIGATFFSLTSNEVKVTVTEAVVEELTLAPGAASLHAGESVQLQAEASFSDGTTGNLSGSVRWVVSQIEGPDSGAVAIVDANGRVEARDVGRIEVVAIYEQAAGSHESNVADIEVVGDAVAIDGADLRVVGLQDISSGDELRVIASVKNSGGAAASAFWVDLFVDHAEAPVPPATGEAFEYVALLEPGQTVDFELGVTGASLGEHTIYVFADSFGNVEEGDGGEANNIWGPEVIDLDGSSGPAGPDLSVSYLSAFPQASAEQVLYLLDITNQGDVAASAFEIGIFADPGLPPVPPASPDESVVWSGLEPGETVSLDVIVRAMPTDFWQSWVVVDSAAAVTESNEANNTAGVTVTP